MKSSYWWYAVPVLLAVVAGFLLRTGDSALATLAGLLVVLGLGLAVYMVARSDKE